MKIRKKQNPPFKYLNNNLVETLDYNNNKIYKEPDSLKFIKGLYLINIPDIKLINISMFSDTYYFYLNKNTYIDGININLDKGEYIFKWIKRFRLKTKSMSILTKLSRNNLIPKIVRISENFIIMNFIQSVNLLDLRLTPALSKYLFLNISKELKKWHLLGIYHGDLTLRNILIDLSGKVWLIDPDVDLYDNLTKEEYEELYDKDVADLQDIKEYLKL